MLTVKSTLAIEAVDVECSLLPDIIVVIELHIVD